MFLPRTLEIKFGEEYRRRGNVEEEMFLPRTLKIKFGEEYSTVYIPYYTWIECT